MTGRVVLQYAVAAVGTTAEGMLLLVYAPYLDGYGYALPTIGVLSALLSVFRLVSRVPTGAAYRPARSSRQLALWLVVFTVATSGFAIAGGSVPIVVLLTVAHGYAFGALGTLNLAVVIDLTEGRRAGSTMGWYTAALSLGYAIGAFVGGALSDAIGIPLTTALMGALPALAAPLVLVQRPPAAPPHEIDRVPGLRGLWRAHRELDVRVWLAFVIVLYLNLVSDAVDTFFALYGLAIGLPLAATGALKGVKSGAATFIRMVSGVVFRYVDHRAVNFWGVLLMGAATFALPLVGAGVLALGALFLVAGLCRGLLRVTSAAMVAQLRAEGRSVGVASGVYNAGLDIGAVIGPLLGGAVGAAAGLPTMFQIVAGASVLAYLAVALSSTRGRAALGFGDPRARHAVPPASEA